MNSSECTLQQLTQAYPLPLSPVTANVIRYIQGVYFFIAFPIALSLNIFSIILIAKFKKLHNTDFYLILQVIVANVFIVLILFPAGGANVIANAFVLGGEMCQVLGLLLLFLRYARNLLMLVLATDRLCTVFLPFWYLHHRIRVVLPLSITAWILSFLATLPPVYGILGCFQFTRFTWSCTFGNGCDGSDTCSRFRTGSITFGNICVLISLVMYLVLYCKARQLKKRTARIFPASETVNTHSSSNNNTSVEPAEQASIQQQQRRATITYVFLFLALFGAQFPGFIFFVIGQGVVAELGIQPPEGYIVSAIVTRNIYTLLVIIDPITLMRNGEVREVIRDCWKTIKEKLFKN